MTADGCDDKHESSHGHHHDPVHSPWDREYLDRPSFQKFDFLRDYALAFLRIPANITKAIIDKVRPAPQPFYHWRHKRVPMIDDCMLDDVACFVEAQLQHDRDKLVESNILKLLLNRKKECLKWHYSAKASESFDLCKKEINDYEEAMDNYYIKYGDTGPTNNVINVYMKQKHRMIWERRHGPIDVPRDKQPEIEKMLAQNVEGNPSYKNRTELLQQLWNPFRLYERRSADEKIRDEAEKAAKYAEDDRSRAAAFTASSKKDKC